MYSYLTIGQVIGPAEGLVAFAVVMPLSFSVGPPSIRPRAQKDTNGQFESDKGNGCGDHGDCARISLTLASAGVGLRDRVFCQLATVHCWKDTFTTISNAYRGK